MELNIDTWLDPICMTQDQNLCSASSVTEGQQNDTHGSMPLNTSVSGNWSSFWKQMLGRLMVCTLQSRCWDCKGSCDLWMPGLVPWGFRQVPTQNH